MNPILQSVIQRLQGQGQPQGPPTSSSNPILNGILQRFNGMPQQPQMPVRGTALPAGSGAVPVQNAFAMRAGMAPTMPMGQPMPTSSVPMRNALMSRMTR